MTCKIERDDRRKDRQERFHLNPKEREKINEMHNRKRQQRKK